jgi:hypothetical protein
MSKIKLFFFIWFLCGEMIAMDSVNIKSVSMQLIDLIDKHLNHRSICAIGSASKFLNAYMKQKTEDRKKITTPIGWQLLSSAWHPYGSAGCFVCVKPEQEKDRQLRIVMTGGRHGFRWTRIFENFFTLLPHTPVLFLNEEKQWCFYGCGKTNIGKGHLIDDRVDYEVVRYDFSARALPLIIKMLNACGTGYNHWKAICFRNYPCLLQSILDIKKTKLGYGKIEELGFLPIDRHFVNQVFLEVDFDDVVLEPDWQKTSSFLKEPDFFVLEKHPSLMKIIERYYQKQCELRNDWIMVDPD